MIITLLAHHIEWDTDGDIDTARGLPSKVEVEVNLGDITHGVNINDIICDQLSDATGWCVLDYKLEGYSAEADYALQMQSATAQNK
jgi:hypothetical protein